MKNIADAVVDRLCKYMEEKDLTQYKLSQKSGVPFATVKSIMQRRTRNISLKTVIMLVGGLEISAVEFFNDDAFSVSNLDLN